MMRRILALVILSALATAAYSQQPNALLPAKDASALFKRSLQLAESTSAAVPGLAQAGGPVLENARQALINLESGPAGSVTLTYNLLTNLRAYLVLAESVPKPYPFPEEGRKQFAELRDSVDRVSPIFAPPSNRTSAGCATPIATTCDGMRKTTRVFPSRRRTGSASSSWAIPSPMAGA